MEMEKEFLWAGGFNREVYLRAPLEWDALQLVQRYLEQRSRELGVEQGRFARAGLDSTQ